MSECVCECVCVSVCVWVCVWVCLCVWLRTWPSVLKFSMNILTIIAKIRPIPKKNLKVDFFGFVWPGPILDSIASAFWKELIQRFNFCCWCCRGIIKGKICTFKTTFLRVLIYDWFSSIVIVFVWFLFTLLLKNYFSLNTRLLRVLGVLDIRRFDVRSILTGTKLDVYRGLTVLYVLNDF